MKSLEIQCGALLAVQSATVLGVQCEEQYAWPTFPLNFTLVVAPSVAELFSQCRLSKLLIIGPKFEFISL